MKIPASFSLVPPLAGLTLFLACSVDSSPIYANEPYEPDDLEQANQLASLAGCPESPSTNNPVCLTTPGDVSAGVALEAERCGLSKSDASDAACIELDQPGTLDTRCPPVATDNELSRPGCCTATGQCGGMETTLGWGCILEAQAVSGTDCGD